MSIFQRLFGTKAKEVSPTNVDALADELIALGRSSHHYAGGPCWYWEPGGQGVKNKRAIQIGQELHRIGGGRVALMQSVLERVSAALGAGAAQDLSAHWHRIGEPQSGVPVDEVWLH